MYQDPTTAVNPWSTTAGQDQSALNAMQTNMGGFVNSQQGGAAPAQPMTSAQYPSYSNAYGLGSGNPNSNFGQPAPSTGTSSANYATEPISVQVPDTSARGQNPWTYMGDAGGRDVPQQPAFK